MTLERIRVHALLIAFALIAFFGSAAYGQETWAPVVMLDGVDVTINGVTQPVPNGPVTAVDPIFPGLTPNAPFAYPNGFAENPVTHEWIVADTYHSRLLRFASEGNTTYAPGSFLGSLLLDAGTGVFTAAPYGPVVDDDGTIIVPDYYGNRLQLFVPSGGGYQRHTVGTFRNDVNGGTVDSFNLPIRVALAPDPVNGMSIVRGVGIVWLLDQANNRVVKLLPGGTLDAPQWTAPVVFGRDASVAGPGPGNFFFPAGLAVDAAGNVYVSDPNNTTQITIQVFDPGGNPLQIISQGLSSPWALAISPVTGRLFVADTANNRIAVFDKYDAANPTASLQPATVRIGTANQPLGGTSLPSGVPNPAGPIGELQEPSSIAFDSQGRLLAADTDDFRIQIFDRARLIASALAVPQTVGATDTGVVVRVTVAAPPGQTTTLADVQPTIPTANFAQGGGPGTPVVSDAPSCITTPASPSACVPASALGPGETLAPGGQLQYTFTFDRIANTFGPVWFSLHATAIDGTQPVISPAVQTYAVAVGGDAFNPPQIAAAVTDALGGTAASGWYATQPVDVHLSAFVPNPGANLDPASGDGQVQEIEYNLGPTAPVEGNFFVCFNFYTELTGDASCTVPIFKEGITTLWYRALSTRGLYDHLAPSTDDPTVKVPGWTPVTVQIDITAPTVAVFPATDSTGAVAPPHHGWFNVLPLTSRIRVSDLGSQLDTVTISSTAPGFSSTMDPTANVPFAFGTMTFGSEGRSAYQITAADRAGNTRVFTGATAIDVTPPVPGAPAAPVSSTPLVSSGGATWSRSPIAVTWSATDALSGFDDAATPMGQCTATASSGVNQFLSCTFEDWAGNRATTPPLGPFGIDTAAPTVTTTITPAPLTIGTALWFRTAPASVTFDADDHGGSGFANGLQTDSATVSSPGGQASHTFTDLVGNSTTTTVGPFNVDNAPPTVTVSAQPPDAVVGSTPWYGGPVGLTFTADDHGGVGFQDPAHPQSTTQTSTLATASDGSVVSETFTDLLGNSATASAGPYNVDTAPPVVTSTVAFLDLSPATGAAIGGTVWYRAPIRVTFTAIDAGAGFATAAPVQTATGSVDVTAGPQIVTSPVFTDVLGHPASGTAGPFGVDATPPALTVPADLTVAASPTGPTAAVDFSPAPSATDNVDPAPAVTCTPASGSTLTFGATTVSCTATDEVGNATTRSFTVNVVDRTPPVLTPPASPVAVAINGSGPAVVTFEVPARDNVDPHPVVVCTPASGSSFPVGRTPVSCTATDATGNSSTAAFDVVVSSTPPVVTVPANVVAEATGPGGAVVAFTASATDVVDGTLPVACVPASNSLFPLGATTVTCTAVNSANRSTSARFTVTVVDTTPPALATPPGVVVVATGPAGAIASFAASAIDVVDGAVAAVCLPPSGSTFPLGQTIVTCRATDRAGNTSTLAFPVVVQPSTPDCTRAAAVPSALWPPNHKLVPIGVGGVTNADGGALTFVVGGISQDEPTNGLGDGDTPIDGFGVGTGVAMVRAERAGLGDGRVYHIRFTATSQYGPSCAGEVTVGVPHDLRGTPAMDGGPQYDSTLVSAPPTSVPPRKNGKP